MLVQIMLWLKSLGLSEEAQGLVEYVLIIALIAIFLVVAMTAFRTQIAASFAVISAALKAAPGTP